jgi:glucosamine 6-phosphate synthetase-like amidotransferase/phosphosugar isomerase protein
MVIGLRDDPFYIGIKKDQILVESSIWIFLTKTNTYSFYHDSRERFLMFESVFIILSRFLD